MVNSENIIDNFKSFLGVEVVLLKLEILGVHLNDASLISAGNQIHFHCKDCFKLLTAQLNNDVLEDEIGDAYNFKFETRHLNSSSNNFSYVQFIPEIGEGQFAKGIVTEIGICLLYTSPSPRDRQKSRMPSSA